MPPLKVKATHQWSNKFAAIYTNVPMFHACVYREASGDKSGTASFLVVAQGKGSSFRGHFTVLAGGTGDLASLRGEGPFSGTATGPLTSAGTYTGQINFR